MPTEQQNGWDQLSVWTLWRRENSLSPPGIEPRSSFLQHVAQSQRRSRYPRCYAEVCFLFTQQRIFLIIRPVNVVLTDDRTQTLTYLLTPWCRVLLEKLTGLQLVKKFPAFHGTRRFITALTSVRHLSLSWASPILSIYPHSTSWSSILILSTHLRLCLPSGLLPSGFPSKTLYTPYTVLRDLFTYI